MPGRCEDVDAIATAVGLPSSAYPVNTYAMEYVLRGQGHPKVLLTFSARSGLSAVVGPSNACSRRVPTHASDPLLSVVAGNTGRS